MSADNKAIAREYIEEVWIKGNLNLVDKYIAPTFVGRTFGMPVAEGREGFKQMLTGVSNAFANPQYTIEDLIAEGNKVVVRWTFRGTHQQEIMGIAPTGKRVEMTGTTTYRMAHGQVQEWWEHIDFLGMLQQLGAIPK
jgi:predicted ester cyclase